MHNDGLAQCEDSPVASSEALSIVLPAKNEAVNLVKLLPVLRQEFPDAEILVVNDGSTDDTVALCEAAG
ncbi:MAG TPA: glycosyltransferase, partial [Pseudomonadaceae bacterium]|nr:glycosyltransferase [Pseudomonadaceae bacterium]